MVKLADLLKDAKPRDEYLRQATDGPAPKLAKAKGRTVGKRIAGGPKEAEILKAITEYLKLRGIFFRRMNTQGAIQWKGDSAILRPSSSKGCADIIGALPGSGRMFAIEVKAPGGRVSAEQDNFISDLNRTGGLGFIATDLETVDGMLRAACMDFDHVSHCRPASSGVSRAGGK